MMMRSRLWKQRERATLRRSQPNDKFAIQPVFIYQQQTHGNPADAQVACATGLVLHRSCFACIRAGFDHTSSGAGLYDGWLRKFTLAPQIGAGRKFFSRLVLRAFVTYAN
jgi:maltoporin